HLHYTYSFLSGVEEYLREKIVNEEDWSNLFDLFRKIKLSEKRHVDEEEGRLISTWTWLEKEMADILQLLFTKNYSNFFLDKRNEAIGLIRHLFEAEGPNSEDAFKEWGDLYTTAINSTR